MLACKYAIFFQQEHCTSSVKLSVKPPVQRVCQPIYALCQIARSLRKRQGLKSCGCNLTRTIHESPRANEQVRARQYL